ncbi:Hsp33 family molecular chaperone HslO [Telmatospirillum sp. J64-1]|uniref:Hsp33 family molecular chaperone HslO n=1 Tax=Telmatospirillum sp. J64-1 TaxID=2502183 RepID=UPI002104F041|nr:Hsp33 family molecular chaperone HslO [Telmatospirillum sp. J64-1]
MSQIRNDDLILPFQISANAFRGRIVRLGKAVDEVLAGHNYPKPVAVLLGQALALGAALAGALKYDGIFTLQIQGDGPVNLLVADITSSGNLRGYARFDEAKVTRMGDVSGIELLALLGKGYIAFTVDQGADTDRYQGIVELTGKTLANAVEAYFRHSEQLESVVKVAAGPVHDGHGWRAEAILLQRMPLGGQSPILTTEEAEEAWNRAGILLGSVTQEELLNPGLDADKLLYRLFHAEDLVIHEGQQLQAKCRCSAERVSSTLKSFPREEVDSMKDEEGKVVVVCEFCKTSYVYGQDDLDRLYSS